ncbi:hypothetical protein ACVWY3_004784 [Bradyrhizobium sp. USDA 4486]
MNNVDPFAWLSLMLQRVANGWPSSETDAYGNVFGTVAPLSG